MFGQEYVQPAQQNYGTSTGKFFVVEDPPCMLVSPALFPNRIDPGISVHASRPPDLACANQHAVRVISERSDMCEQ